MNLIYSGEHKIPTGKSIFLAGCSPRKGQALTWRKDAIQIYQDSGFDGTLVIPEPLDGVPWADYMDVVEWEDFYLRYCDVLLFWVPRSVSNNIYGFTTNVEFGRYLESGRVVYGRPLFADNNRYLDYWYRKQYLIDPFDDLESLIRFSLTKV